MEDVEVGDGVERVAIAPSTSSLEGLRPARVWRDFADVVSDFDFGDVRLTLIVDVEGTACLRCCLCKELLLPFLRGNQILCLNIQHIF